MHARKIHDKIYTVFADPRPWHIILPSHPLIVGRHRRTLPIPPRRPSEIQGRKGYWVNHPFHTDQIQKWAEDIPTFALALSITSRTSVSIVASSSSVIVFVKMNSSLSLCRRAFVAAMRSTYVIRFPFFPVLVGTSFPLSPAHPNKSPSNALLWLAVRSLSKYRSAFHNCISSAAAHLYLPAQNSFIQNSSSGLNTGASSSRTTISTSDDSSGSDRQSEKRSNGGDEDCADVEGGHGRPDG